MYCVKCGVRLQEGVARCPLCHTPVWNPELPEKPAQTYPDRWPAPPRSKRYPFLALVTVLCMAICLPCLIYCLNTYGGVYWSGYVMLAIAVVYFSFFFPSWFDKPHPLVFLPLFFVLTDAYLLYICLDTGGDWFLSFAFPVVLLVGLLVTGAYAMYHFIRHKRLLITGILLIVIGNSMMLVEMFEHITFGTKMFTWSLYSASFFSLFGGFLILAGLIRPLREYLERKFFL